MARTPGTPAPRSPPPRLLRSDSSRSAHWWKQDEPPEPARRHELVFDANGDQGLDAIDGEDGEAGQLAGEAGERGEDATLPGDGYDAGTITVEVTVDRNAARPDRWDVVLEGTREQHEKLVRIARDGTASYEDAVYSDEIYERIPLDEKPKVSFYAHGGAGGRGGVGGNGGAGAAGASEFYGRAGGDGGRGGRGSSGGNGGNGGRVRVRCHEDDLDALTVVKAYDVKAGGGGAPGQHGSGGKGGAGGAGSREGGRNRDGPCGAPGVTERGLLTQGADGKHGTFRFVVIFEDSSSDEDEEDDLGFTPNVPNDAWQLASTPVAVEAMDIGTAHAVHKRRADPSIPDAFSPKPVPRITRLVSMVKERKQATYAEAYTAMFDARLSQRFSDPNEDGIIEPGDIITPVVTVKNTGDLPLPRRHCFLRLPCSQWVKPIAGSSNRNTSDDDTNHIDFLLPRIRSYYSKTPVAPVMFRVADRPADAADTDAAALASLPPDRAANTTRWWTKAELDPRVVMPRVGHTFEARCAVSFNITYPIELSVISGDRALVAGATSYVRWGVKNISLKPIGGVHLPDPTDRRVLTFLQIDCSGAVQASDIVLVDETGRELTERRFWAQLRDIQPNETRFITAGVRLQRDVPLWSQLVLRFRLALDRSRMHALLHEQDMMADADPFPYQSADWPSDNTDDDGDDDGALAGGAAGRHDHPHPRAASMIESLADLASGTGPDNEDSLVHQLDAIDGVLSARGRSGSVTSRASARPGGREASGDHDSHGVSSDCNLDRLIDGLGDVIQENRMAVLHSAAYEVDPGAVWLLVINETTSRQQIDAWTALAACFGTRLRFWNLAFYGQLSLTRKLVSSSRSLLDDLPPGALILVPNNTVVTRDAARAPAATLLPMPEMLAAARARGVRTLIIGPDAGVWEATDSELAAVSLPILPIPSESESPVYMSTRAFLSALRRGACLTSPASPPALIKFTRRAKQTLQRRTVWRLLTKLRSRYPDQAFAPIESGLCTTGPGVWHIAVHRLPDPCDACIWHVPCAMDVLDEFPLSLRAVATIATAQPWPRTVAMLCAASSAAQHPQLVLVLLRVVLARLRDDLLLAHRSRRRSLRTLDIALPLLHQLIQGVVESAEAAAASSTPRSPLWQDLLLLLFADVHWMLDCLCQPAGWIHAAVINDAGAARAMVLRRMGRAALQAVVLPALVRCGSASSDSIDALWRRRLADTAAWRDWADPEILACYDMPLVADMAAVGADALRWVSSPLLAPWAMARPGLYQRGADESRVDSVLHALPSSPHLAWTPSPAPSAAPSASVSPEPAAASPLRDDTPATAAAPSLQPPPPFFAPDAVQQLRQDTHPDCLVAMGPYRLLVNGLVPPASDLSVDLAVWELVSHPSSAAGDDITDAAAVVTHLQKQQRVPLLLRLLARTRVPHDKHEQLESQLRTQHADALAVKTLIAIVMAVVVGVVLSLYFDQPALVLLAWIALSLSLILDPLADALFVWLTSGRRARLLRRRLEDVWPPLETSMDPGRRTSLALAVDRASSEPVRRSWSQLRSHLRLLHPLLSVVLVAVVMLLDVVAPIHFPFAYLVAVWGLRVLVFLLVEAPVASLAYKHASMPPSLHARRAALAASTAAAGVAAVPQAGGRVSGDTVDAGSGAGSDADGEWSNDERSSHGSRASASDDCERVVDVASVVPVAVAAPS